MSVLCNVCSSLTIKWSTDKSEPSKITYDFSVKYTEVSTSEVQLKYT